MRLKTITAIGRRDEPAIQASRTGRLNIGRRGAEDLFLEAGDRIDILQDEESPKDFYLKKGGSMTIRKSSSGMLYASNAAAVRAMAQAHGILPPFRMRLGIKPNDEGCYPLIVEGGRNQKQA